MRTAERLPHATRRPARGISARGRGPSGAEAGPGGTVRQMRARSSPGTWLRSDCLGEPVDRPDDPGEGGFSQLPQIIQKIEGQATACAEPVRPGTIDWDRQGV